MIEFLKNREVWERLRDSDDYDWIRQMIFDEYDDDCKDQGIPHWTFSDEMDYQRNGDRKSVENPYYKRRRQLTLYALKALMYPEENFYIERLEDVICEICNEFSWQVPAHRGVDMPNKRNGIDLFAAETGVYLAETKHVLKDRLNPIVTERISENIKFRIIDSFLYERKGFENVKHNWASVCGGGVGRTFMYEAPELFDRVKARIENCMQNYRDGYTDEGGTSEGADYWKYGFAAYVMYYDALRRFTGGKEDMFRDEKTKKIADFLNATYLSENNIVTFSDGGKGTEYPIWLVHFLKKEYGTDVPPLKFIRLGTFSGIDSILRDMVYYNPEYNTGKISKKTTFFESLQWYISRRNNYSFAAKGGNNDEFHNHLDIGSFIVEKDGIQYLSDLGSGLYTRQYFGDERYTTVLNTSARGHSIPEINGVSQKPGSEYFAKMNVFGDKVTVDMSHAYELDIKKFDRTFELSEENVVLEDTFDNGLDVTEHFITPVEPVVSEGCVDLGKIKLLYNKNYEVSYVREDYPHYSCEVRTAYILTFRLPVGENSFKMDIISK